MSSNERKPMVLVLADLNGSGKTMITEYFELVGTYTNADELVMQAGISNQEAAKLVDQRRYESIQKKKILRLRQFCPQNTGLIY